MEWFHENHWYLNNTCLDDSLVSNFLLRVLLPFLQLHNHFRYGLGFFLAESVLPNLSYYQEKPGLNQLDGYILYLSISPYPNHPRERSRWLLLNCFSISQSLSHDLEHWFQYHAIGSVEHYCPS